MFIPTFCSTQYQDSVIISIVAEWIFVLVYLAYFASYAADLKNSVVFLDFYVLEPGLKKRPAASPEQPTAVGLDIDTERELTTTSLHPELLVIGPYSSAPVAATRKKELSLPSVHARAPNQ